MEDLVYKGFNNSRLASSLSQEVSQQEALVFMQKHISRILSHLVILWISILCKNVLTLQASSYASETQKEKLY